MAEVFKILNDKQKMIKNSEEIVKEWRGEIICSVWT